MAYGGTENKVMIFDKRNAKIVRTFDQIHTGNKYILIYLTKSIVTLDFLFSRLYLLCEMESKW